MGLPKLRAHVSPLHQTRLQQGNKCTRHARPKLPPKQQKHRRPYLTVPNHTGENPYIYTSSGRTGSVRHTYDTKNRPADAAE